MSESDGSNSAVVQLDTASVLDEQMIDCGRYCLFLTLSLKPIVQAILEDYALPLNGDHGVAHWARVLENGLLLAEETGANVEVLQLFAVLHDSRRENEVTDPKHDVLLAICAQDCVASVILNRLGHDRTAIRLAVRTFLEPVPKKFKWAD